MKYLYAVRNRITGELVKDLVNPPHKFWEREADCRKAIVSSSKRRFGYYPDMLELVKFELVEVDKEGEKRRYQSKPNCAFGYQPVDKSSVQHSLPTSGSNIVKSNKGKGVKW